MRILFLILISLIIGSAAHVSAVEGQISSWEISVDLTPPADEHLEIFFNIENKGTENIKGVELSFVAESAQYVETEKLSFDGASDDEKTVVEVTSSGEKITTKTILPTPILPGETQNFILDFETKGLFKETGNGYTASLRFDEPRVILSNDQIQPTTVGTGSIRVHAPEGYIYTTFEPDPWRQIWQGVSGFNAHFILIFNGGTRISQPITVSFRDDPIIERAVGLYKALKAQEKAQTRSPDEINEANRLITDGANFITLNKPDAAKNELDKAEAILTGKTIEEVIEKDIGEVEAPKSETPVTVLYFIIGAVIALLLLLIFFGKNILSALKGGKKEDEK